MNAAPLREAVLIWFNPGLPCNPAGVEYKIPPPEVDFITPNLIRSDGGLYDAESRYSYAESRYSGTKPAVPPDVDAFQTISSKSPKLAGLLDERPVELTALQSRLDPKSAVLISILNAGVSVTILVRPTRTVAIRTNLGEAEPTFESLVTGIRRSL